MKGGKTIDTVGSVVTRLRCETKHSLQRVEWLVSNGTEGGYLLDHTVECEERTRRMNDESDHSALLYSSDLCDTLAVKEDHDNSFSFIPTNYRSDSVEI